VPHVPILHVGVFPMLAPQEITPRDRLGPNLRRLSHYTYRLF
jgi:hypothetical protein